MKSIFNVTVFFLSALLTVWTMVAGWGLTAKNWPVIASAVLLQFILVCVHANVSSTNKLVVPKGAS